MTDPLSLDFFDKVIANNSPITLILAALAFLIWFIGANILTAFHYKRVGQSMWTGLLPFKFPFWKFNANEWSILALLLVVALGRIAAALELNNPKP